MRVIEEEILKRLKGQKWIYVSETDPKLDILLAEKKIKIYGKSGNLYAVEKGENYAKTD